MNTTNLTPDAENTVYASQESNAAAIYIEDLFNDEGAFGEADCAGL